MSNKEYMNIYNGCLKGECLIKKYLPLKDSLIKIIKHYDDSGCFERGYYDIDGINICIVDFMKNIFKVFDRVINENLFAGFDEYVEFLINIELWYEEFENVLGMFVQKSVLNYTDFNAACNLFYVLCNNALCKDYYVVKCTSDNKLINMFKSYLYYYKSPYEMNITKEEKTRREIYIDIGPRILACFMATNHSIECLNRVLDKLCYDCENFKRLMDEYQDNDYNEKMHLSFLLDENEYTENVIK